MFFFVIKPSFSIREIDMGVPQGSIIGLILFIIYTNHIDTASDKLNFISYVDDSTLSCPIWSFTVGCSNIVIVRMLNNSEIK